MLFGHTGMARKVLVAWYAKLLGVQYIADPHYQIIGVQTPETPRIDACARLPSVSHQTEKRLLKLKYALVRMPRCLSLSPDSKN